MNFAKNNLKIFNNRIATEGLTPGSAELLITYPNAATFLLGWCPAILLLNILNNLCKKKV